jgi:hypothetical protein
MIDRWGGSFSVPLPRAGQSYGTLANSTFMCAGCAHNDPANGHDFGSLAISV